MLLEMLLEMLLIEKDVFKFCLTETVRFYIIFTNNGKKSFQQTICNKKYF